MALPHPIEYSEETRRLTRRDWLKAGLAVLVDEGVEAVQITRLARKLDVTRGSFYWHFADRGALLDALIETWHLRNTGAMDQALEEAATLAHGILELFLVWVDHRRFDPELDQALRDWARRSEAVRAVVEAEDTHRVAAIAAFFRRHGYPDPDAFIRARVLYFTQISYYALRIEEPMAERKSYLAAYYRAFTGQELAEADAEEFFRRLAGSEVAG